MKAQPTVEPELVEVAKSDLIQGWSVLERIVVSLHKIGSHHATPSADVAMTPAQRQNMLRAMDDFFDADFFRDAASARRALSQYVPGEEAEAISDSLRYWEPQ